jgi:hypothetical protein
MRFVYRLAPIESSSDDKDIDIELYEFGHKARDTVQLSLSIAILN